MHFHGDRFPENHLGSKLFSAVTKILPTFQLLSIFLYRHSGEGRVRSEAFQRYPGGFKKLVFLDVGSTPA